MKIILSWLLLQMLYTLMKKLQIIFRYIKISKKIIFEDLVIFV